MRINKFLATCGVASRRQCDKLIEAGSVTINGRVANLWDNVKENSDVVKVNGAQVKLAENYVYYIMNKPKGVISAVSDDRGRKTVVDLIKNESARIYPVGRLDYDSEGLLLLTNDGDLAFRLTHPANEVPKTYVVRIEGTLSLAESDKLKSGIEIGEGEIAKAGRIHVTDTDGKITRVEIVISEGKNREIRRMMEALGKNVVFLKRTKIGDLRLSGLNRGEYRKLTAAEIEYLKNV